MHSPVQQRHWSYLLHAVSTPQGSIGATSPFHSSTTSGLGPRFSRRFVEDLRIRSRIKLQRCVLGRARILSVLFVVAHERNVEAVNRLPIVHIGFTLHRSALTQRAISLFQDMTVLWIDKPTDGGASGIHIYDAGLGVADLFRSIGAEKHIGIFRMCGDKDGIALDLFESLRYLGRREVVRTLTRNCHEGGIWRDHDVHGAIWSIHFRMRMIRENDNGLHV